MLLGWKSVKVIVPTCLKTEPQQVLILEQLLPFLLHFSYSSGHSWFPGGDNDLEEGVPGQGDGPQGKLCWVLVQGWLYL